MKTNKKNKYQKLHRCEYYNCKKVARYPLRLKDGSVIAWYCKEHYEKVLKEFASYFERRERSLNGWRTRWKNSF